MTTLKSFRVQLAERIRLHQLEKYYTQDDWVAQPKLDGVRLALVAEEGQVYGINRKGTVVPVPHPLLTDAMVKYANGRLVVDGEWVDSVLWVFDVPYAQDVITPASPYWARAAAVDVVVKSLDCERIQAVNYIEGEQKKRDLVEAVQRDRGEGVILRDLDGPYLRGKRSRFLLKCKFVETVDVVVLEVGREGKSSMAVGLLDERRKNLIDVGSVTLSARWMETLEAGDVVEIEYLYCTDPRRPRLYQPVMKCKRDDKSPLECDVQQLKFTDKTVRRY